MAYTPTFKMVHTHGESYECDDCGTCYPEETQIFVDDTLVWERATDGHYSGHQTEKSLLDCVLDCFYDSKVAAIEANKTEYEREQWNKKHPGNAVATTTLSWKKYHDEQISFITDEKECVKECCANLPSEEFLQLRMIALWIEDYSGTEIEVRLERD